jgi:hypothetical protein
LSRGGFVSGHSPVIVLGFYRGGTTLLQRALNCFRNLVVWGEHAGFLKDFARAYAAITTSELRKVDPAAYAAFDTYAHRFVPWANRFDPETFLAWQRNAVANLFSLDPNARWGFKEIRYNDLGTLEYLAKLFPGVRFLFLTRNPEKILISRLLVRWENRFDSQDEIDAYCADFEDEWQTALAATRQLHKEHSNLMFVSHEELVERRRFPDGFCQFLGLDPDSLDRRLLNATLDARAGSSFGDFRNRKLTNKHVSTRVTCVREFVAASPVFNPISMPMASAPDVALRQERQDNLLPSQSGLRWHPPPN